MVSEEDAEGIVQLVTDPPLGEWSLDLSRKHHWKSTGGYTLTLTRNDANGHGLWTVDLQREDHRDFRVHHFAWQWRIPLAYVAAVFDTQAHSPTSLFRQAPAIDAAIHVRPNQGVAYQAATDHYANNRLAVGAMDVAGTYRITGRKRDDLYTITLARDEYAGDQWFTGTKFNDAVFVSTKADGWFETARAYADQVDERNGYVPNPLPTKADLPYYSTWYAFGDQLDGDKLRKQAQLAQEMGCGVFQIFIGWSVCEDWFGSNNAWGDYTPCKTRFDDFAGLVRYLQNDLDMAVQVWTAPTWIGAKSQSFKEMQSFRSKWPNGDYSRHLDPRSPAARDHIRERFAYVAKQLKVDGFYVDFADTLFNRNDAVHAMDPRHFGTAYEQFLAAMKDGFLSERETGFMEYRQPFANLTSKRYATVFNTTYTDGDWEKSKRIAVVQRPFSRGVIHRCDPLTFTREQLSDRDFIGKAFSATILCGVPGISLDLEQLDEATRERLAAWLDFYRQHREVLSQGELRPFGEEYHDPELMLHRGSTAFARVARWETGHLPFPDGTRHAFIFTALPEEVSFIARLDPRRWSGLTSGRYRARWVDSSLESHDGWFDLTIDPPPTAGAAETPLESPREIWDFDPRSEGIPSLDIRRGGFLELQWQGE